MTAQGVMSSSASKLGSALAGFSAAEGLVKETNGASFEEFMTASKETRVQEASGKEAERAPKEAKSSVREHAKDFFTGDGRVKEVKSNSQTKTTECFDEAEEAVATLMVQVQQVICSELGISEEELVRTMEELGMDTEDLLDRTRLQELFLQLKDASEPTELLTNEELFGDFTELLQTVEQMLQEAGVTSEEIKLVLREQKPVADELVEEAAEETDMTAELPNTESDAEEVQQEPAEAVDASVQKAVRATTQTETQNEGGSTGEKHTVAARKEENATVISSETDAEVRNVFIDTLANVTAGTGEEAVEAASQLRGIADQIMEQIKIVIRPEQTNMELQLNPEHLGRVHLTITEKEGMMTAQFTTQSEVAKEAIESQMAALRESLQNQGIRVEHIEVTVSEFGFERDRDAKQNSEENSGKQKRRGAVRMEDAEEPAPTMAEFLNVTDSSVDYSA